VIGNNAFGGRGKLFQQSGRANGSADELAATVGTNAPELAIGAVAAEGAFEGTNARFH